MEDIDSSSRFHGEVDSDGVVKLEKVCQHEVTADNNNKNQQGTLDNDSLTDSIEKSPERSELDTRNSIGSVPALLMKSIPGDEDLSLADELIARELSYFELQRCTVKASFNTVNSISNSIATASMSLPVNPASAGARHNQYVLSSKINWGQEPNLSGNRVSPGRRTVEHGSALPSNQDQTSEVEESIRNPASVTSESQTSDSRPLSRPLTRAEFISAVVEEIDSMADEAGADSLHEAQPDFQESDDQQEQLPLQLEQEELDWLEGHGKKVRMVPSASASSSTSRVVTPHAIAATPSEASAPVDDVLPTDEPADELITDEIQSPSPTRPMSTGHVGAGSRAALIPTSPASLSFVHLRAEFSDRLDDTEATAEQLSRPRSRPIVSRGGGIIESISLLDPSADEVLNIQGGQIRPSASLTNVAMSPNPGRNSGSVHRLPTVQVYEPGLRGSQLLSSHKPMPTLHHGTGPKSKSGAGHALPPHIAALMRAHGGVGPGLRYPTPVSAGAVTGYEVNANIAGQVSAELQEDASHHSGSIASFADKSGTLKASHSSRSVISEASGVLTSTSQTSRSLSLDIKLSIGGHVAGIKPNVLKMENGVKRSEGGSADNSVNTPKFDLDGEGVQLSDRSSIASIVSQNSANTASNPLARLTLQDPSRASRASSSTKMHIVNDFAKQNVNALYDISQQEALAMFYLNESASQSTNEGLSEEEQEPEEELMTYRVSAWADFLAVA